MRFCSCEPANLGMANVNDYTIQNQPPHVQPNDRKPFFICYFSWFGIEYLDFSIFLFLFDVKFYLWAIVLSAAHFNC